MTQHTLIENGLFFDGKGTPGAKKHVLFTDGQVARMDAKHGVQLDRPAHAKHHDAIALRDRLAKRAGPGVGEGSDLVDRAAATASGRGAVAFGPGEGRRAASARIRRTACRR